MVEIHVTLKSYLARHGITPYRLAKEVKGIGYATVYAIASGTRRPNLETLEAILSALPKLTQKPVALEEILDVVELPDQPLRTNTGPIAQGKLRTNPASGGKPQGLKGIRPKGGLVSALVAKERE